MSVKRNIGRVEQAFFFTETVEIFLKDEFLITSNHQYLFAQFLQSFSIVTFRYVFPQLKV